jgi:cyclic pyranopterin phosphate synthase
MGRKKISMIDVTDKPIIYREAIASGIIKLKPETIQLIKKGKVEKGDPLETAKIAGILAAKNTSQLIPMCHPLPLTHIDIITKIKDNETIEVSAKAKTEAKTGVEMEALVATATALLTIWDMVKKYEKDEAGQYPHTKILEIRVNKKVKREK